jgi:dimethylamine monooxygenase subunit A
MPWPVSSPFRMRPNLEKLDSVAPALLLRDELAQVYRRERERVLIAHRERATVGTPNENTLVAIQGLTPSPAAWARVGVRGADDTHQVPLTPHCGPQSSQAGLTAPHAQRAQDIALDMQEDFVILKQEADTLRTEYLSVCFPSRWDPREKLGFDFAAIHAPVADNQMLLAAGPSIMTMAFMKQPMLRHVWLIVPSASLAQHPEQNDYSWSETLNDSSPLLPRLYFRVERQTTWPLPQFDRAVFFIRVMMSPLTNALRIAPDRARELRDSLASMSPAVVAYRGMSDAMPRLLSELGAFV